jgi:hypothetical protein
MALTEFTPRQIAYIQSICWIDLLVIKNSLQSGVRSIISIKDFS